MDCLVPYPDSPVASAVLPLAKENRLRLGGLEPHRVVVCPLGADCRAPLELVDHLVDVGALNYLAGELLAGVVGLCPSTVPLALCKVCACTCSFFFCFFRRSGGGSLTMTEILAWDRKGIFVKPNSTRSSCHDPIGVAYSWICIIDNTPLSPSLKSASAQHQTSLVYRPFQPLD